MYAFHQYAGFNGTRVWFWYQEPTDITDITAGNYKSISALNPTYNH
jgi:hypothetical protein